MFHSAGGGDMLYICNLFVLFLCSTFMLGTAYFVFHVFVFLTFYVFFLFPSLFYVGLLTMVAVWCSGNALVLINAVALHRARLVLGWVTACG